MQRFSGAAVFYIAMFKMFQLACSWSVMTEVDSCCKVDDMGMYEAGYL